MANGLSALSIRVIVIHIDIGLGSGSAIPLASESSNQVAQANY